MSAENTKPNETSPAPKTEEAAVTTTPPAIDENKIRQEAYEQATKRATDITSLCKSAGCPEKASTFIANAAVTVDAVRTQLFDEMCAKHGAVGASGANPAGGTETTEDPDAAFRAEYKAQEKALKSMGIDEANYVKSRRVDEGIDNLAPAAA